MTYEKLGPANYKWVCDNENCDRIVCKKHKPIYEKNYCSRPCINKGRIRSEEFKNNLSSKMSGDKNPFYNKKHSEETLEYLSKINKMSLEDRLGREKSQEMKRSSSVRNIGEGNPFYGKKHSQESKDKMSKTKSSMIASGEWHPLECRGYKGYYTSEKSGEKFFYESLYELIRMKVLDKDDGVLSWTKKHNIKIRYDNDCHYYIPDFLIKYRDKIVLEELKGYEEQEKLQKKIEAGTQYCKKNDMIFLFLQRKEIDNMCQKNLNMSYRMFVKKYKDSNNV